MSASRPRPRIKLADPVIERQEDEIGNVLGQINQQVDELVLNYSERGDVDSSDTHRLRGLLDLVDEMGDGLALAATLDELAETLRRNVHRPSTLSTNARTRDLKSSRYGVLCDMAGHAERAERAF